MKPHDLTRALRTLTDKQFVEVFYETVQGRHIYPADRDVVDAHLILVNAVRDRSEGADSRWTVELVCPTPGQEWPDDAPICQAGEHCGLSTASWAKTSQCPVCGGLVYGT